MAFETNGELAFVCYCREAFACSTEEELETCCFYTYAPETQPQVFDPRNIYQQMEISLHGRQISPWGSDFEAKSIAPDGFAPGFLGRREGWKLLIRSDQGPEFDLGDAQGLNAGLRTHLPDFNFALSCEKSMPVVVGKWYTPFMFVKEGTPKTLKDQMRMSMFYEITLEQNWEQIFACDNNNTSGGNSVAVDAVVKSEVVVVGGLEAVVDERDLGDGVLWFRSVNNAGSETSIGLSLALVERMKWEQERVGYVVGKEKEVEKREEYKGGLGEWKRFGCYVLVERFVFKRLDGSLALTHKFRHTHQIRTKWE